MLDMLQQNFPFVVPGVPTSFLLSFGLPKSNPRIAFLAIVLQSRLAALNSPFYFSADSIRHTRKYSIHSTILDRLRYCVAFSSKRHRFYG